MTLLAETVDHGVRGGRGGVGDSYGCQYMPGTPEVLSTLRNSPVVALTTI